MLCMTCLVRSALSQLGTVLPPARLFCQADAAGIIKPVSLRGNCSRKINAPNTKFWSCACRPSPALHCRDHQCIDKNISRLPNECTLWIPSTEMETTTSDNIASMVKISQSSKPVTLAVANLYLRQQIILRGMSMMKQWTLFPTVLQRKFLLTLLAGIASAGISVIICVATKDHILLALGIVVLCACLISCRWIWATAAHKELRGSGRHLRRYQYTYAPPLPQVHLIPKDYGGMI